MSYLNTVHAGLEPPANDANCTAARNLEADHAAAAVVPSEMVGANSVEHHAASVAATATTDDCPAVIAAETADLVVNKEMAAFHSDLVANLPEPYEYDESGNCIVLRKALKKGEDIFIPICSPFVVMALTRTKGETGWGARICFSNPDGRLVNHTLLYGEAGVSPDQTVAQLMNLGFKRHGNSHDIVSLIFAWETAQRICTVEETGWVDDRNAFILPSGEVIEADTQNNERIVYAAPIALRDQKGTLKSWQAEVAPLLVGNAFLIFAFCVGLVGPLLRFAGTLGTAFHLYGVSSSGKSSGAALATSLWSNPAVLLTWRSTANGLESQLALNNGTFAAVDELPAEEPDGFADHVYMIGNAIGRVRASKTGGATEPRTLSVGLLSTGEKSIEEALLEWKKAPRAGQLVRVVDVCTDGGRYGVFNELHGHADGGSFAVALREALCTHHSVVGSEFVRAIVTQRKVLEQDVRRRIQAARSSIVATFRLPVGAALDNEAGRVVDKFALAAVAGELATEFEIVPWETGTATKAVAYYARRWFEKRGGNVSSEVRMTIEATRDFLLTHELSRFSRLHGQEEDASADSDRIFNRAGYRDDEHFYLTETAFREISGGKEPNRVAQILQRANFLRTGAEKGYRYRMPIVITGRPRLYRISRDILQT